MRYLVTSAGVDAERLEFKGYGETEPLIPNATTEEDHAKNRRVEFHIAEEATEEPQSEEPEPTEAGD